MHCPWEMQAPAPGAMHVPLPLPRPPAHLPQAHDVRVVQSGVVQYLALDNARVLGYLRTWYGRHARLRHVWPLCRPCPEADSAERGPRSSAERGLTEHLAAGHEFQRHRLSGLLVAAQHHRPKGAVFQGSQLRQAVTIRQARADQTSARWGISTSTLSLPRTIPAAMQVGSCPQTLAPAAPALPSLLLAELLQAGSGPPPAPCLLILWMPRAQQACWAAPLAPQARAALHDSRSWRQEVLQVAGLL